MIATIWFCVVANAFETIGKEIDDYSAKHKGQTNVQFAAGLFKQLAIKYYRRHWIVIAYNPIWGFDNHTVRVSGYIRFRKDGRNILVASVDHKKPVMNLARAEKEMNKASMTYRVGNWFSGYWHYRQKARTIFNSLDKTGASLVGVIRCNANVALHAHSNRLKYVKRCPDYYFLVMWG